MIKKNNRDKLGKFKKGFRSNTKTEIKKGQHLSKDTEIKRGQHLSKRTEFKKIYTDLEIEEHKKQYQKKWRAKNKEKIKAQYLANKTIKIPKNTLCKFCKKNFAKVKHHKDYSKPYEVNFICYSCHNKRIKNRDKNHIKIHLKNLNN